MSRFYSKPSALAKLVLARAADINNRVDATEAAFDLVEAEIDVLAGFSAAAAASAAAALASETAAGLSETAAAASESAAAASASSASSSASTATTQAGNASTSAGNAATSESNAATSETNAGNSATYAAEWANKAEDSLISVAAGGDNVDDYSALHHANKAADSRADALVAQGAAEAAVLTAAEWAENPEDDDITSAPGQYSALHHAAKAEDSATAAAASAAGAASTVTYAAEWANKAEDSLVSAAAGGDQVDDYSALHHAAKAAASAAAAATFNPANYVEIAGDTMTGALGIVAGAVGAPGLFGTGDTDTGVWLSAANTLDFSAGGVRALQMVTAASGVNYVVVTPAATTAHPDISAAGSDANINLKLTAKGTGVISPQSALTMATGKTVTFAPTTSGAASANMAAGTVPSSPSNGDIWNLQYSGLWFLANSVKHNLFATNDWVVAASATTLDLGAIDATCIEVSGTTAITSFGTSAPYGTVKVLRFQDALTLPYNPTGHIMAGTALTTQTGDIITVAYLDSISGWHLLSSSRYGGGGVAAYYTATRYGSNEYDAGNSGTAQTITWSNGMNQKSTLTGNVTYTFSNPTAGMMRLKIVQGAGPYTITWPTIKWKGGTAPTISTGSGDIDIVTLYYDGTSYHGVHDATFAAP